VTPDYEVEQVDYQLGVEVHGERGTDGVRPQHLGEGISHGLQTRRDLALDFSCHRHPTTV
jgi:hypothetical protein